MFMLGLKARNDAVFNNNYYYYPNNINNNIIVGSRDGVVVRALTSHQCGLGFNSLTQCRMWVKFVGGSHPCSKRFSLGTPVFPSPQKPTFLNSNSIWKVSPNRGLR